MANTDLLKAFFKFLAFSLVAGIVGPLFLIMYFVFDGEVDGESVSWMLWAGVAVTSLDVVLALVFAVLVTNSRQRAARLAATGYPAFAEVTGLAETGTEINGRRVVAFDLTIQGPRVPEFAAHKRIIVPTIAVGLLPHRVLAVFVEPGTHRFEVDWDLTQLYAGTAPTRITSTSDGVEYDLTGNRDGLVQIFDVLARYGVPVQGRLNLRSSPQARDEVMEVVRAYGRPVSEGAAPAGSGEAAGAPAGDTRTLTQRLNEIDALYAGGRITRPEYDRLRAGIVDGE